MPKINIKHLGAVDNKQGRQSQVVDPRVLDNPRLTKNWLLAPNSHRVVNYDSKLESEETFDQKLAKLKNDMNLFCCDCHAAKPDWISVNNGVFLCI